MISSSSYGIYGRSPLRPFFLPPAPQQRVRVLNRACYDTRTTPGIRLMAFDKLNNGSIFCPGSRKAWDEYCTRHNLAFIVLGNRQSVFIKQ